MPSIVTITPPVAPLEFTMLMPPGWERMAMPDQTPDFSDPKAFLALAIFRHAKVSGIVSIVARPAYGDGTLLDWLRYLAREQGFEVELCEPYTVGGKQTVSILATQLQEAGTLRLRVAIIEDGGSMIVATGMAPVEQWMSAQGMMEMMLSSIALTKPQGRTARLTPDEAERSGKPAAGSEKVEAEGVGAAAGSPPAAAPASSALPSYAAFALSDDATTLDAEHPVNVSIRESGSGLVPHLIRVEKDRWVAFVGAGAIEAILPVPLGWHVIDDGKRTLMFDRLHDVQVSLEFIDPADQGPEAIFNAILADVAKESPDAQYNLTDLEGMPAMVVRDIVVDGTKLQQLYLLKPVPHRPELRLKLRATVSDPQHIVLAGDLVERLANDMKFLGEA